MSVRRYQATPSTDLVEGDVFILPDDKLPDPALVGCAFVVVSNLKTTMRYKPANYYQWPYADRYVLPLGGKTEDGISVVVPDTGWAYYHKPRPDSISKCAGIAGPEWIDAAYRPVVVDRIVELLKAGPQAAEKFRSSGDLSRYAVLARVVRDMAREVERACVTTGLAVEYLSPFDSEGPASERGEPRLQRQVCPEAADPTAWDEMTVEDFQELIERVKTEVGDHLVDRTTYLEEGHRGGFFEQVEVAAIAKFYRSVMRHEINGMVRYWLKEREEHERMKAQFERVLDVYRQHSQYVYGAHPDLVRALEDEVAANTADDWDDEDEAPTTAAEATRGD